MGAHTYYPLGQARTMLGKIDWKTLNKWLNAAGITPEPDPKDNRIKRISRTQLVRLASLHGITLLESDAVTLTRDHAVALLLPPEAGEQAEVRLEAFIEAAVEERLEEATGRLDAALQHGLQEIKQELLTVIQDVFKQILSPGAMPPPLRREERVGRPVPFVSNPHAPVFSPPQQSEGALRQSKLSQEAGLPPNSLPVHGFAEAHDIPYETLATAIERNELRAENRPMESNAAQSSFYFTAEQAEAAIQWWLEKARL